MTVIDDVPTTTADPAPSPAASGAQTLRIAGAMAAVQAAVTLVAAALLIWSPDTVADLEARPETQYSGFGTILLIFGALQLYGAYQALTGKSGGRMMSMSLAGTVLIIGMLGLSGEGAVFPWIGAIAAAAVAGLFNFRRVSEDDNPSKAALISAATVGLVPLIGILIFDSGNVGAQVVVVLIAVAAIAALFVGGKKDKQQIGAIAGAVAAVVLLVLVAVFASEWRVFQVVGFLVAGAAALVGVYIAVRRELPPLLAALAATAAFVLFFAIASDGTLTQIIGVGWSAAIVLLAFAGAPKKVSSSGGGGLADGWRVAFWFLLPAILGFCIFYLLPTIRAITISFQDFPLLENEGTWIGFENYREVLGDDLFTNAIWVTFKYVVINIGTQTVLALAIAVMMDRLTKSVFVRSILLLPWLLPNVMVGLLWLFMLDPTNGIINEWLGYFGVDSIGFLSNPDWAIPSLAFINTWKFTGYTALLLFAGMQTVPSNLYEAASLDGASEWRMFTTITLPLLRPVIALVMVISLIGSFQVFDVVAAAGGGLGGNAGDPLNSTRVLYLYIFEKAFTENFGSRAGQGAAAATLLMLGLLVITVIQLRLSRAGESDLA